MLIIKNDFIGFLKEDFEFNKEDKNTIKLKQKIIDFLDNKYEILNDKFSLIDIFEFKHKKELQKRMMKYAVYYSYKKSKGSFFKFLLSLEEADVEKIIRYTIEEDKSCLIDIELLDFSFYNNDLELVEFFNELLKKQFSYRIEEDMFREDCIKELIKCRDFKLDADIKVISYFFKNMYNFNYSNYGNIPSFMTILLNRKKKTDKIEIMKAISENKSRILINLTPAKNELIYDFFSVNKNNDPQEIVDLTKLFYNSFKKDELVNLTEYFFSFGFINKLFTNKKIQLRTFSDLTYLDLCDKILSHDNLWLHDKKDELINREDYSDLKDFYDKTTYKAELCLSFAKKLIKEKLNNNINSFLNYPNNLSLKYELIFSAKINDIKQATFINLSTSGQEKDKEKITKKNYLINRIKNNIINSTPFSGLENIYFVFSSYNTSHIFSAIDLIEGHEDKRINIIKKLNELNYEHPTHNKIENFLLRKEVVNALTLKEKKEIIIYFSKNKPNVNQYDPILISKQLLYVQEKYDEEILKAMPNISTSKKTKKIRI